LVYFSVVNLNIVRNSEFSPVELSRDALNFKFLGASLPTAPWDFVSRRCRRLKCPTKIFYANTTMNPRVMRQTNGCIFFCSSRMINRTSLCVQCNFALWMTTQGKNDFHCHYLTLLSNTLSGPQNCSMACLKTRQRDTQAAIRLEPTKTRKKKETLYSVIN
jgi:hypothetical protein